MSKLKEQLKKRLNSIENAYTEAGRATLDFSMFPEDQRKYKENQYHAEIIVEAARKIEKENGFGEIDWNDGKWKYTPWFWMSPSSFAFSGSNSGNTHADAGSGSRLRVLSEETCLHIGTAFPEIWEILQLG